MSTAALPAPPPAEPLAPPALGRRVPAGWLFGPTADALCVASLYWPLVVAVVAGGLWVEQPLSFLQIYFISSPHRWITLALVFLDGDRMAAERGKFLGLGAGLIGLGVALVYLSDYYPRAAHSLVLLMMFDYIWNAWHFAAQHAGIARIYGRASRVEQSQRAVDFERAAVRVLVLWSFVRVALSAAGTTTDLPIGGMGELNRWLAWIDPLVAAPAAVAFGRAVVSGGLARCLYLGSVVALYSGLLAAIALGSNRFILGLLLASALFHAGEYLSVCFWAVRKKSAGVWKYPLARSGLALAGFIVVVGVGNWLLFRYSEYAWALVTLLVSLLHYAYDGMIWKARPVRPVGS